MRAATSEEYAAEAARLKLEAEEAKVRAGVIARAELAVEDSEQRLADAFVDMEKRTAMFNDGTDPKPWHLVDACATVVRRWERLTEDRLTLRLHELGESQWSIEHGDEGGPRL